MKTNFLQLCGALVMTGVILTSCQKETTMPKEFISESIDVSLLNDEAKRYYSNMAEFMSLTTSNLDAVMGSHLKTASLSENGDDVNPILSEFANLEIEDEYGNEISFFDLNVEKRELFLEQWMIANAYDMTPKLEDSLIGKDLEEYIKLQNDAFDEAMQELAEENETSENLKSSLASYSSNDIFIKISEHVQDKICKKSTAFATKYLSNNSEVGISLKGTGHPDYVNPTTVLSQLRTHANRGNLLINMPGSVWLSAYLFYYNPAAISKYAGTGKYPPGHVSIVRQTKTAISTNTKDRGVSISSQNWNYSGLTQKNGVRLENVFNDWNCKVRLCSVQKRVWQWQGFRSRWKNIYPNANKVLWYAENNIGKSYCKGNNFVTAKTRSNCFICTTITWKSFKYAGFDIHKVSARWMPTIAPTDIYLSNKVILKRLIK